MSEPLTLAVLYEDNHLLVVNKPAPLLTQAPPGIPSLEALAKAYLKEKYHKPGGVYLGIPHRLDRPVSGVVCFARNTKAARRVHEQFHNRQVVKRYWALVSGRVSPPQGEWHDWLYKLPEQSRVEPARPEQPGARVAVLAYRCLAQVDADTDADNADDADIDADHPDATPAFSWLELQPLTGRTHQLRAQTAWRGHPILGDHAYGSPHPFGPPAPFPTPCRIVSCVRPRRGRQFPLHGRHDSVKLSPVPPDAARGPPQAAYSCL